MRLQVLLPDDEMAEIRRLAASEETSVGEWVRGVLRKAREDRSRRDPAEKLAALREAVMHSFPTGDIEDMNAEIERGYSL